MITMTACILRDAKEVLDRDTYNLLQEFIDWEHISKYPILSESFIREFQNKVTWYDISQYSTLSESFIREFQNKVK